MTKELFLNTIQQQSCYPGTPANNAWKVAIDVESTDKRWYNISAENCLDDFVREFKVEVPAQRRRPTKSMKEVLQAKLEKAIETHKTVLPKFKEESAKYIKELEEKIAKIDG